MSNAPGVTSKTPREVEPGSSEGLRIEGLTKLFSTSTGGVAGIRDVNLHVPSGQFVCVIGPSGCGKTTILNLLVGLAKPDAGQMFVDGVPLGASRAQAKLGYMLARDSLFPWRTALQNVLVAMEVGYHKVPNRRQRDRRARDLLDAVGLSNYINAFPAELSQGMRQRVAIARTLACEPKVFLMDEPFGALDAQTRHYMHEEFVRVWEQNRRAVLFVTHDLDEAIQLADRIVVVNGRPGTITGDHTISVPRAERLEAGNFLAELADLRKTLWEALRID